MQDLAQITGIILCGGLGTRLRSVVSDRPKALAEISGRPFLTCLLEQLHESRIRNVVLCIGHLGDQIQALFGTNYGRMELAYSHEFEPLGTAGAVRFALPLVSSQKVLIMNGDSFCDINLEAFCMWHQLRKARISIALTGMPDTRRYGRIQADSNGKIREFVEKGEAYGAGWINAGIYIISRHLIESIPTGRAVSLETDMFPKWIKQGIHGYMTGGEFIDIGTPESYKLANKYLLPKQTFDHEPLCCVGS